MIPDSQTNTLYLADCLPKKHPKFFSDFETVLKKCNIPFLLLPDTKDIWAIDYMPVQVSLNKFIQFVYNPDYLQNKTQLKTISDVDKICGTIGITPKKSELIIDGGNIIRSNDKVIMCDKVFKENSSITEKDLIKQLKDTFEVDKLFFVPWDKSDFTGHADGMIRFIDNDRVLINDYSKEKTEFQRAFRMAIHNAGIDWIELPYVPYDNKPKSSAEGIYINYLQMEQAIIIPTFKCKSDEKALRIFEQVFKGQNIVTIDSNEIAQKGGILNCITWNIKQ